MTDQSSRWRTIIAIVAIVAALSGCSSSSDEADPGSETAAGESTSTPAAGSGRLTAFQEAIDGLAAGYTFDTEVTVDGERLTRVVGLNLNGDTSFSLETETSSVEVIAVGAETWTRTAGADWEVADSSIAGADPLAPLADVETATFDPASEAIQIEVPGAAFGIELDTIVIDAVVDEGTVSLSYSAAGASVTSIMAPAPDGAVVAAPVPLAG